MHGPPQRRLLSEVEGALISGNTIVGPDDAVSPVIGLACAGTRCRIADNHIEAVAGQGLLFSGSDHVVSGNVLRAVGSSTAPGIQVNTAAGSVVADNHVRGAPGAGLYANAADRLTLSGNRVEQCGEGITIVECHDALVHGNACCDNAADGIVLHTSLRVVVVGNRSGNTSGAGTQTRGVRLMSAPANGGNLGAAVITGNVLSGNVVEAITLSGADDVVGDNVV